MRTFVNSVIVSDSPAHPVQQKYSNITAAPVAARDDAAQSRKLALLKKTGLFSADTKGAVIERACSAADLREAYRLVHQVYLESGYIHPEPTGMRVRIFETSSETATFVAKVEGRVVGVISVVGDSLDLGLPSDAAFSAELDALRDGGAQVCEVTNQVVAEPYRKSAVTTELMRAAVAHALQSGFRVGVATVSPSHNGFYDLLGFTQLGSERSYSQKLHDPVVALMIDWDNYRNPPEDLSPAVSFVHQFLGPQNPMMKCVAMWDRKARAAFLNPELLEQLFINDSNFLASCSPAELETVRMRWGIELFRAVVAGGGLTPANVATAHPFEAERSAVETFSPFPLNGVRRCLSCQTQRARRFARSHFHPDSAHPGSSAPWWPWLRSLVRHEHGRQFALGH